MIMNIITITFTEQDVRAIARSEGVPFAVAMERATEWGKYIQDTATTLCSEQLASVVRAGQP